VVDAIDDSRINIAAAGCRNNDFFSAGIQVSRSFCLAGEKTGTFMNNIDA